MPSSSGTPASLSTHATKQMKRTLGDVCCRVQPTHLPVAQITWDNMLHPNIVRICHELVAFWHQETLIPDSQRCRSPACSSVVLHSDMGSETDQSFDLVPRTRDKCGKSEGTEENWMMVYQLFDSVITQWQGIPNE